MNMATAVKATGNQDSVEVYSHPDAFPDDVLALFAAAEKISVEFGVPWYRNLVDAVFKAQSGVHFYVLRRQGVPVAALPIVAIKVPLGYQVESLANYYTALYAPAVAPGLGAAELVPLLKAVCAAHAPMVALRLAPMDPQSVSYGAFRDACKLAGLKPFPFYSFGNWFMQVGNTWPQYLASREGTVRSTIKRAGKKFAAEGGTLELIQGGAELEGAIEAYQKVYAASWKVPEPYPEFVPGLIRTCAGEGWLRLGVARLKGEPVAAQIWIVAHAKAYIYKLAYHEDYKAFAPGTLLTAKLMEHAMASDGVREIDYLIGDDAYKKSWMDQRRERWGLIAYNPRTLGGCMQWVREAAGRALKPWLAKLRKPGGPSA